MTAAAPPPTDLKHALEQMRASAAAQKARKGVAGAIQKAILNVLAMLLAMLEDFRAGRLAPIAEAAEPADEGAAACCSPGRAPTTRGEGGFTGGAHAGNGGAGGASWNAGADLGGADGAAGAARGACQQAELPVSETHPSSSRIGRRNACCNGSALAAPTAAKGVLLSGIAKARNGEAASAPTSPSRAMRGSLPLRRGAERVG
jgi:hypothetical protein